MRLSQRQDWGIVYFWELLQLPVELLNRLWMKKEPGLYIGQEKKRTSVSIPRPRVGKASELCQLSRIKRNKPGSRPELNRSCGLPFQVLYHLSSPFLYMLLKKNPNHHQKHKLLLKLRHTACRPRCLWPIIPTVTKKDNVPLHEGRIWCSKLMLFHH